MLRRTFSEFITAMFSAAQKPIKLAQLLRPQWKPVQQSIRQYLCGLYDPGNLNALLRDLPRPEISTLQSGLTVATERRETNDHACVGLYIDAGSRNESPFENGIANFFQHLVFKGTNRRTKECLHGLMNNTGARFGAVTTREHCYYYANCLTGDTECVIDLLIDCVFNNSLDPNEIEYQKEIVYSELLMHDYDANEIMWDYLHGAAFQGTKLSQSVPGPSKNLPTFSVEGLKSYLCTMFHPCRAVLAYVGPLSHECIISLTDRPFISGDPCYEVDRYRFTGADFRFRDDNINLANCAIAFEGPSMCDEETYALDIAAAYLGSWDAAQMGSRNNAHALAQAGNTGLCDRYQAFNIKYRDCSLWGVQFLGDRLHLDEMVYNIQTQIMKLCTMITPAEVEKAKFELKNYILTHHQSTENRCHDLGRWVLYDKCCPCLFERLLIIEKVQVSDLQEICTKYLYDKDPAVAGVGPVDALPDYNRIRAGQYWLRL